MTSTTLNYKGGFKAVFVKTFKQQLPGAIVLILLSVFVSVFSAASTIVSNASSIFTNKYDITDDIFLLVNYFSVICMIFSLFLAMQMFKEIYSKRACDTFFALPIKRNEYFLAKYLYGAVVNIVAMVVMAAIHIVILLSASTKLVTYVMDFSAFFKVAAAFLLDVLCVYTLFVFCAVLSGRRVQYFFFVMIALFAPVCITTGAIDVVNKIWGVDANSFIVSIIHPVQNILMLWESSVEYALSADKYLYIIIAEAVETIALFAAGYIVFKKRKAEIAEFTPSGKVLPFMFLAFVIAAEFLQCASKLNYFIAMPLAILFSVIGTMIFSGVFYKKIFAKNTVITLLASGVLCILFVGVVNFPSYSNYVKYVPEADEIESVELIDGSVGLMNYSSISYYTDALSVYDFETSGSYKFTAAENIENAIQLHKKIIDDETIKKGKALNSGTWGDMMQYDYEYENSYECRIVYHLKNGQTVTRRYAVPAKMISDEMFVLMKTEEALSQFGITAIKSEDIVYSTFESEIYSKDTDAYNKASKNISLQETEEILKAYKKDLLSADKTQFLDYLCGYTSYYTDYYTGDYYYSEEQPVDTENMDYIPEDSYWVYVMSFTPNADDEYREKIRAMSIEDLNRLSVTGGEYLSVSTEEYYEKLTSDSLTINPDYKNTYKYLQSLGLLD